MARLSETQKQRIRSKFYATWKTCINEAPNNQTQHTWTIFRHPMLFVLPQVIKESGVLEETNYNSKERVNELIDELELTCATCGSKLDAFSEVGKLIEGDEFWQSFDEMNDDEWPPRYVQNGNVVNKY
jgi:hypothetical protein